ncbi:hypothetical protein [Flavobacterium eburneipallidum]|uniref:hypothetical protein n=1 Tax=Flavobacterium eburneipallidum TaxID=3003263 RepID=UPI0024821DD1|nr:hypothetical protein [Flavobacterium eburneipallidum]
MKKSSFYVACLMFFLLTGCGYKKDKLSVKNITSNDMCCVLLAKDINKGFYYQVGDICKIKRFTSESPIIHTTMSSISDEIKDETNDGNLYVLFYNEDIQDYVYKNMENKMDNLIHNKKIKSHKYSLKELDSLNWQIEYKAE